MVSCDAFFFSHSFAVMGSLWQSGCPSLGWKMDRSSPKVPCSCLEANKEVYIFFCFCFHGHSWGIWKFPGQGLNKIFSCLWPTKQHCWIWAVSVTYTAACGNSRPLAHGARPGIEPASLEWQCCGLNPPSHSGNYLTRRIDGNIGRF